MNIPKTIIVGPYTFKVEEHTQTMPGDLRKSLVACVNYEESVIRIRKDYSDSMIAHYLLHEIFHVINDYISHSVLENGSNDNIEATIDTLSCSILMVIQDNPELIQEIMKTKNEKHIEIED